MDRREDCYLEMAKQLPKGKMERLLDLGCCTGLDYEAFLVHNPAMEVTGVAKEEKLQELLRNKQGKRIEHLRLIYGTFLDTELGSSHYDVAISDSLVKNYDRKQRLTIYKKISRALITNGMYMEFNYHKENFETQVEYTTTIAEQISLFLESGFQSVQKIQVTAHVMLLKAMK